MNEVPVVRLRSSTVTLRPLARTEPAIRSPAATASVTRTDEAGTSSYQAE